MMVVFHVGRISCQIGGIRLISAGPESLIFTQVFAFSNFIFKTYYGAVQATDECHELNKNDRRPDTCTNFVLSFRNVWNPLWIAWKQTYVNNNLRLQPPKGGEKYGNIQNL